MSKPVPTEMALNNEGALEELNRLIRFSQGEFALILAVCNSTRHRQQLLRDLRQTCPVPLQEVTLHHQVQTLYSTLCSATTHAASQALMVHGLEAVEDLDQVLVATNQIREEFRRLTFPLVLWITNDSLKRLIRVSPDFYTWANTVTFETPTEYFLTFLEEAIEHVWSHALGSRENRFLSNAELGFAQGSPRTLELQTSLTILTERGFTLSPATQAALAFVQGRIADNSEEDARLHYERSLALWQSLMQPVGSADARLYQEKAGHLQFYLGLWWRSYAAQHRRDYDTACDQARQYFEAAVQTFEAIQRPDLAAKYINFWADTLQRLSRWDQLEAVTQKALRLYQQHPDPFREADTEGFVAEVALSQGQWAAAEHHAQRALDLIQAATEPTAAFAQVEDTAFLRWVKTFRRSWFLFSLGKAQLNQEQLAAAAATLETACTITLPKYDPSLYSRLLSTLQACYFQQGEYLKSFEAKQVREGIESRFGFRAFVGAGRLQPKQKVTNLALPHEEATAETLIAASGREHDIQQLLRRLSRDEFILTIIYGPSGVGKSSLIEAGLVPALEQTRFENRRVLPVRIWRYQDWINNLRQGLEAHEPGIAGLLSQLRHHSDSNRVTVLIFDQFEEFFFECERLSDRQIFYEFFRECLDLPYVKVLLSLREDYIHYLLECDRMTPLEAIDDNILDRKWLYYLGNFTPADARNVICDLTQPTAYAPSPELIDQIVADLAEGSGEVRPIELQIVGAQLQADNITTIEDYLAQGTKESLVQRYIAYVVRHCGPPENQKLADIILYLLTDERGTRPLKTRTDLKRDYREFTHVARVDAAQFSLVLDILTRSGLVVEVPESPDDRYQLVHDYIAAFLRSSQQPVLDQIEHERKKRIEAEHRRTESERKRLIQAQWAALGLGVLALLAIATSALAWGLRQRATQGELNAQIVAASLATEAYFNAGLEDAAVIQAVRTGQLLQGRQARQIEEDTRLRAVSAMREVIYDMQERERLIGHGDSVLSVAFSPDGDLLATASADKTAKIWTQQGEEVFTLAGHQAAVWSVAFSPDGDLLATASADKTVKLWTRQGALVQTLSGHGGAVTSVAFSPDGQVLASSSSDNTVKLWSRSGQALRTLTGHGAAVTSVAFSPDGAVLATASSDNTVKLWDLAGQELQTLTGHQASVWSVAFSPDGQTLATVSQDNTVKLWDRTGTLLRTFDRHSAPFNTVVFSPDGQTLAMAGGDNTVKLWSLTGEELQTFPGHNNSVVFSPDGQTLATASSDNTVKLWRRHSDQTVTLQGHEAEVTGLAFNPGHEVASGEGPQLATASADYTVKLWNAEGTVLQTLRGHTEEVTSVAFSPACPPGGPCAQENEQILATASADRTAKLWQINGAFLQTLIGHEDAVLSVAFSPDGQTIATASADHTVKLWNLAGAVLQTLEGHQDEILKVVFSPDGQTIATASADETVRLWNRSGAPLRTLQGHRDWVYDVAFSADGQTLATASRDNTVKLWSRSGEDLRTLQGHSDWVYSVAFSPDGQTLATASRDQTVKLWSVDGEELQTLNGHQDAVFAVVFSPDGQTLATASRDQTVKLWNFQLDDLLKRSCGWLETYLVKQTPDLLAELTVCQTPERLRAAVPTLLNQAEQSARSGNLADAVAKFRLAQQWDPSLDFDPQQRAEDLAEAAGKR